MRTNITKIANFDSYLVVFQAVYIALLLFNSELLIA